MRKAILTLQYPDNREARTIALAATRSPTALQAFKEAVLAEAKLAAMDDWDADEVLHAHNQTELERLNKLLGLLIPGSEEGDRHEKSQ
ncbi:hypothetical protein ACFLUH_03355 [Chloroflexota bacterium]